MSGEFAARLTAVQSKMDQVLERHLMPIDGPHAPIAEAMRYAALGGGKRLRPFLLAECHNLFAAESETVWDAAAALECVHVYSLVHDDLPCMDDDDLRRGRPTVHRAFDEALAVLTGDALLTRAFAILAGLNTSADIRVQLTARLAKAAGANGMIGGQVIDIRASEKERNEAAITQLQRLKTGALIEYAAFAGACLGGASSSERDSLEKFAQCLGLAFQIRDDILDVEGDTATLGKAANKDESQGKATFVSIFGLEGAKQKARDISNEAKGHLEAFDSRAKMLLSSVDFVLEREK